MDNLNAEALHVADAPKRQYAPIESARNRLLRLGAAALTDAELLSLIVRTHRASRPMEELLTSLGGLHAVAQLAPWELSRRAGVGPNRAASLLAALELGRRILRSGSNRPILSCAKAVYRYLAPTLEALRNEVFHVLCINTRNRLLLDVRVAEGNAFSCPVDPREVFSAAITSGASGIILAHNHPSGDPSPSKDDLAVTEQLVEGGRLLGVKVVDHVIIGQGRFVSFDERGLLPESRRTTPFTRDS